MVFEDKYQEESSGGNDYFDLYSMTTVQVLTQDVLVASIMLGLTAFVGLLGNVLMIRALCKYVNLRVDFFILLGSVAMADILCLVVSVPMHILHLTHGPVTDTWCKVSKYLDAGSSFVVAYHLVVLSVLRGILLTSRGRNPPTPLQTLICVGVLWVIALLVSIPFLSTIGDRNGFCMHTENVEKDMWTLNAFACFVPILLIIFIYILTHLVGKRYFEDSYSYKEKQMSRLVSVIVFVFVLCQVPYRAIDMHVYYKETESESLLFPDVQMMDSLSIARNYLLCLMLADKAARPVIYSKMAPQLSQAFDEVINCTMCSRAYTGRARVRTTSGGDATDDSVSSGVNTVHTTITSSNSHAVAISLQRGNGGSKNKRIPSTSSNAPLTGGQDRGSDGESDHDHALPHEVEVVDEGDEVELREVVTPLQEVDRV